MTSASSSSSSSPKATEGREDQTFADFELTSSEVVFLRGGGTGTCEVKKLISNYNWMCYRLFMAAVESIKKLLSHAEYLKRSTGSHRRSLTRANKDLHF